MTPEAPVAEVLARIRQPGRGVSEAAQIYVREPPALTPTGRYLGTVGFQRLLREPPSEPVGRCIEESSFVRPDLPEREVATRLAACNLVGRFLGAGGFLVGQTALVIGWLILNTVGLMRHWDPYPFILLNLAFSTQAAYAAPLILLALADVATTADLTDRLGRLEKLIKDR